MKEAVWGVLIVALGLLGIVIVQTFQNVTVTNDQTYYLLKETTEAAMLDAVDLTYYRKTGEIRIVEDKFVENLTRRFAESANANQDYNIIVHDVVETPPFVSVSIGTHVFSLRGDTFEIQNSVDSIIETKYSKDEYRELIDNSLNLTCITGECEVTSCINGDLRFTGWEDVYLPDAVCKQGAPSEDIDRDANYQVCNNGTWENKKEEVTSKTNSSGGSSITYTWNFKKESELHDIDVTTKEVVEYGNCVESFTICPPGGITIYVGESSRLTPSFTPDNVVNKDLSWTSSNTSVLVQGNTEAIVTGDFVGNAVITARSSNNKTATCDVKVVELGCPSQPITMDPNSTVQATLENGVVPSNAIWRIGNDNYATIDSNGKITSKDMYGTYWYYVEFNNTEVECPFIIKNPQQKDLIVTCDKDEMNIYEKTTCTVKSSEVGETLTGVTLSCTNNNTKLTPVSKNNNTIVCSPNEVGELNVNAIKSGYTPGNKTIPVSKVGEETISIECVKSGADSTPLSTGINFNTYISCSVVDDKKANLKFEYKSYTGNTVTGGIKEIENGSSIDFITGSTKGTLILTAKKGTQEVIKYFEVGCIPGDMRVGFNLGTDKIPAATIPTICPQYFDYRFDEDEQKYIKYYETFPNIYNHVQLCGVYGNTSPLGGEYSISGSSEDLKELKNYRSYWDNDSYIFVWDLGKISPNYLSLTENIYKTAGYFEISYDKNDFARFGLTEEDRSLVWSTNVDPYVGNTQKSFSNTFKGVLLDEDDPYCVAFAEEHPLDPNVKPTELVLQLERIDPENYIVPENSTARGYFLQVSKAEPELAFDRTTLGTWTSSDPSVLNVTDWLNNWGKGRITTTGKAGTATITFTSKLSEYGKMKFPGQTTKSASITLSTIESCDQLELQFCPTALFYGQGNDFGCSSNSTIILDNIYSAADIKLNYTSKGNFGTWTVDNIKDLLYTDYLASKSVLTIKKDPKTRTVTYTRTVDKTCTKSITITNRQDTTPPVITVKQNGVEINEIFLLLGDHFDISSYIATATDNITPSSYFDGKITHDLSPDKSFYDNNGITKFETSGKYSLRFTAVDEMGNRATKTIPITVSQYNRRISCTTTGGTNGKWTNQSVTVTGTCVSQGGVSCNDTISYTFDRNTNTTTAGPGPNGGIGQVCDSDGNCATCEATATVKIDTSSPTCTVTTPNYSGGWINHDVLAVISGTDTGGSGLTTNSYNENISTESSYKMYVGQICDKANNCSSCWTTNEIYIDKTDPTCEVSGGSDSWTNKNVTITGICSDKDGSVNSGCTGNKNYTVDVEEGSHYSNISVGPGGGGSAVRVYDNAGNSAICPANQTVKIDKKDPTCSTSGGSSSWTNGTITITGTCDDSGGSGCISNIQWLFSTTSIININGTAGPGPNGGAGTVRDKAGNTATCLANQTVKIDKIAPECSTIGGSSAWTNKPLTIKGTCSDPNNGISGGGSMCKEDVEKTYNTNTNKSKIGPGENGGTAYVYDNAGNSAICPANQTVKIDTILPDCPTSGVKLGSYCEFSLTDDFSGINSSKSNDVCAISNKKCTITIYDNANNSRICNYSSLCKLDNSGLQ